MTVKETVAHIVTCYLYYNKSIKETTRTLFDRLLPDYALSDLLATKMGEWITYKTERKEPYKEQGMKSLLSQVLKNQSAYGDQAVCDVIDESMASGWKGIIFDKLKKTQQKPQQYASDSIGNTKAFFEAAVMRGWEDKKKPESVADNPKLKARADELKKQLTREV